MNQQKIFFFPFTHMNRQQCETIAAVFPSFTLLSMAPRTPDLDENFHGSGPGRIHRVFSPENALESARQKTLHYLEWAQIHKGNQKNLKALLQDTPYFTSDTHVSAIKSQIKGVAAQTADGAALHRQSFEDALLFLELAERLDSQTEQIDLELRSLDQTRVGVVSALRGMEDDQDDIHAPPPFAGQDPGAVMTAERVQAWFCCMHANGALKTAEEMPVFVTTSAAVYSYLEANCTDVVNALDITRIKVHENNCKTKDEWQQQFYNQLQQAVHGRGSRITDLPEVSDDCSYSVEISVGIFSGNRINTLLNEPEKPMVVCLVKLK